MLCCVWVAVAEGVRRAGCWGVTFWGEVPVNKAGRGVGGEEVGRGGVSVDGRGQSAAAAGGGGKDEANKPSLLMLPLLLPLPLLLLEARSSLLLLLLSLLPPPLLLLTPPVPPLTTARAAKAVLDCTQRAAASLTSARWLCSSQRRACTAVALNAEPGCS